MDCGADCILGASAPTLAIASVDGHVGAGVGGGGGVVRQGEISTFYHSGCSFVEAKSALVISVKEAA